MSYRHIANKILRANPCRTVVTLVFRHLIGISLCLGPEFSPESAYFTMSSRRYISSPAVKCVPSVRWAGSFILGLASICLVSISVLAANTHATAIELFDTPTGSAYVQIAGVMINGKTDVRVCDGMPKFDKRAYDLMIKTQLAAATALERTPDGTMMLTVNSKPVCVVPNSLKFNGNSEFTPAGAAEQATLQGAVVSASAQGIEIAPLKPGVKLVFVAAADDELAEFLLAQRKSTVEGWQTFVAHFGSSPRVAEAKSAIAALYEQAAENSFAEYRKSVASRNADLAALKLSREQAFAAEQTVPGYAQARQLREQIGRELDGLLELDRVRLQAYRKALSDHSTGYAQLLAAKQHCDQLVSVNPQYAPTNALRAEILNESRKVDVAVQSAESLAGAKRFDDALSAIAVYREFAPEAPRIDAIVSAAYAYHFGRGQEYSRNQSWEGAVTEFRKAAEIRRDSKEATAAIKNAESQLEASRNQQGAEQAIAESNAYAQKGQYVDAYETLINLPASQQSYVADQLAALQKNYVQAATKRALKLEEIHLPIRGRADEDAIRQAYDLLDHASAISSDPALRLKLDLLSDKISAYYVEQAKRYLEKPMGSGVGLGWMYLAQAQRYKPNLESVRDAMAQYAPAYQLHSRLSIGVLIRDQTSRRDSVGFADQMRDAIASGLESSGLSIKVVRQSSDAQDKGGAQPNFLLVGEILEHRVVKNATLETLQSKYRAATHEVKNEAWLQASRDYDVAQQQLTAAQQELTLAQSQHKKKEVIAADNDAVAAAQKLIADTRQKLDSTEQTRTESVVEPYNYTKKTVDLFAVVDMDFRISDQAGNPVETSTPIRKEDHKAVIILDNVKPEDVQGVKKQGTEPDETQFLTDLEIQTRDALVKAVRDKAEGLPSRILAEARRRAQAGDFEGAAEEYILYSNAVTDSSPERQEAMKFLQDHFNVTPSGAQIATESRLRTMN